TGRGLYHLLFRVEEILMVRRTFLLWPLLVLFSQVPAFGQLWSQIINPSRAVTWTGVAGFPGGTLPDSGWAQCVTTACQAVTSAGSSATIAQINAALASAPSDT